MFIYLVSIALVKFVCELEQAQLELKLSPCNTAGEVLGPKVKIHIL